MKLATYMLEEREDKSLAMEDLLQMTKFVSKNNHFDLNSKLKSTYLVQPLELYLVIDLEIIEKTLLKH